MENNTPIGYYYTTTLRIVPPLNINAQTSDAQTSDAQTSDDNNYNPGSPNGLNSPGNSGQNITSFLNYYYPIRRRNYDVDFNYEYDYNYQEQSLPENNDIFNMKCDDLPQKQKFENNVIEEESLKVAVTEMFSFDDLQKYNIDDFIKTINKI